MTDCARLCLRFLLLFFERIAELRKTTPSRPKTSMIKRSLLTSNCLYAISTSGSAGITNALVAYTVRKAGIEKMTAVLTTTFFGVGCEQFPTKSDTN